jgi:hypothetical protein
VAAPGWAKQKKGDAISNKMNKVLGCIKSDYDNVTENDSRRLQN